MTDSMIFATAVDKSDPAERAAFLAGACGADADRRRRMEELLAAYSRAGEFLEQPAADPQATPTRTFGDAADTHTHAPGPASEDDALALLQPSTRPDSLGRIGHYEVLEVLGRGGFGIVYRAFDDKLQRVVAVKVLAPSLATTSPARKRFLREARATAQIRHDHVVQVYDTQEQPLPYLVMEFIPGDSLQQKLDRTGPLDVSDVLRIGRQVAEGLAAAHEKGLVHRDVKPANVLIDGGPAQRVKLTDFGLARAADDASISHSGIVAGTPMYMAPEQAKGDTLDHRADLFSLGSVLYVMCTGRPPFRASSMMAVLKRVVEESPRPIRDVIPEVPEWLCRIVGKLHAKDPAARFSSAGEVADVLADCERQLAAHGGFKDFSKIPGGGKAPVNRKVRRFAVALAGVAALFWMAILFAEPAYRYATNQAAITVAVEPGWTSFIVWRDGHAVTDWYDARSRPTVTLPPGKYKLEPMFAPGRTVERWEIRIRSTFASRTEWQGDRAPEFEVRRGEEVTVRAVLRDEPALATGPADEERLQERLPKTAADVLPYLAGNWNVEGQNLDPKTPPGEGSFIRNFTYGFVAGGKFLRGRSSETSDRDGGTAEMLQLWSSEPGKNVVRRWSARSDGSTGGAVSGQFHPANRTMTMSVRIGVIDSVHQYEFLDSDTFYHHFFRKDTNGTILAEVHQKWTRTGGPVVLPNLPPDPNRPAEMKVLDRLVGEWRDQLTSGIVTGPQLNEGDTRTRAEPVLGGRFIESVVTYETGNRWDYALAWFDPAAKQYRRWFFYGTSGEVTESTGTWDEDGKAMTWNSTDKRVILRWTFDDMKELLRFTNVTRGTVTSQSNGISRRIASATPSAVPKTAAEVLPFLVGYWKVEWRDLDPNVPPDQAAGVGHVTYDFIAGGKALRSRSNIGRRSEEVLLLHTYDLGQNALRIWQARSTGHTTGPTAGVFNPNSHSFTWTYPSPTGKTSSHQFTFVDGNTIAAQLHHVDTNGNMAHVGTMTYTRVPGPVTIPKLPVDQNRPAEMKVLDRFVGAWRAEFTATSATEPAKPQAETGRVSAASILGGRFLERTETIETNNLSVYSLAWFDADKKLFRQWYFNSTGDVGEISGTWDEAARTLTEYSPDDGRLEGRTVFQTDDLIEFRRVIKTTGGKMVFEATGVSRRVSATPAGGSSPPNPAVVKALQDAVAAKERMLDAVKVQVEVQSASAMALAAAELDLIEARIQLAESADDRAARRTGFRDKVAVKEQIRNTTKILVEGGKVSARELVTADVEVAEARVQLAESEGDSTAVVARLQDLVKHREEERTLVAMAVEAGREPQSALDAVDAKLAKAKARLAKAQSAEPPPKK